MNLDSGWDLKAMIRAGGERGEANDSCHGDSGGPLLAYIDDEDLPCTYAVRGIVSWGSQCGQGSPGVYTDVNQYMDWIVERVWGVVDG
ncbi:unnamed protein product [Plutella xylostella]|uniref:(diamondback moth) hypothetical protein n=1 Tax=Plutella xylostella TaxID=51655 RepID=A0A8S4FYV0_PLUXY|nr:unnamed protein product [Plutella xylostella]